MPTKGGGARRIWPDSTGKLWVTEWFAGKLSRFDPVDQSWDEWMLPGGNPQPYAVFVDDRDIVWLSDFGANALLSFDPPRTSVRSSFRPVAPTSARSSVEPARFGGPSPARRN